MLTRSWQKLAVLLLSAIALSSQPSWSFVPTKVVGLQPIATLGGVGNGMNGSPDAEKDESLDDNFPDISEDDLQVAGVLLDDLSWRVEKLRLEEENTRRFLKAKPRFLPYDECRKWVQAFNRWSTEEEWKTWIAMGEKRNSYVPSRPDEYYTSTGDWVSWDHFFGVHPNENSHESGDAAEL